MRALETEVVDVLWATVEPLLPDPVDTRPLGWGTSLGVV